MVDDEPEPDDDVVEAPLPDMSKWDDAMFHRAAALMVYDAEIEDDERHTDTPNYDW